MKVFLTFLIFGFSFAHAKAGLHCSNGLSGEKALQVNAVLNGQNVESLYVSGIKQPLSFGIAERRASNPNMYTYYSEFQRAANSNQAGLAIIFQYQQVGTQILADVRLLIRDRTVLESLLICK